MENNDDFKYVIQDTGHVYLGKELTYQEILDKEDAPFKFKAIISAYVSKDTTVDVKLTDHKACSFDEFQKQYASLVMEEKAQIEDVSISKLALMAISI